jgi:hypothetical protein
MRRRPTPAEYARRTPARHYSSQWHADFASPLPRGEAPLLPHEV